MIRFLICVTILPLLLGIGFIRLKKEKGTGSLRECYVLGLLFLFLLGEAASCAVIKMDASFSFYCLLFGSAIAVGVVLSFLMGLKTLKELGTGARKYIREWRQLLRQPKRWCQLLLMVMVLVVFPMANYFFFVPDVGSSTMIETISATVATDTVFKYNPVTGKVLEYGMYPIHKFACLPLIYSALYRVSGMGLSAFVGYAIPFWMIAVSGIVLSLWGDVLFDGNKEKKYLFLFFAGVMFVTGDGESSVLAYEILHGGFKSQVAAVVLVIPVGAYMLYQFFVRKERLYGLGGLVLSGSGFLVTYPLFVPDTIVFGAKNSGKEWLLLTFAVFVLYLVREKTRKKWKKQEMVMLGICLFAGMIAGNIFPVLGIAYVGVCLWTIGEERKKSTQVLVGLVVLLCFAGTVLPFRGECIKRADIPQGDVEIQDKIKGIVENYEKEVILVAPENVMEQARLQNSRIILPYGKDLWHENCNREIADVYTEMETLLFEQMKTDYLQPDTIAAMAAEVHCNILVMRERMSEEAEIRGGWQELEGVTGYAVYCK